MGIFSNWFAPKKKHAVAAVGGYEAAAFSRDRSTIWAPSTSEQVNPSQFTRHEIIRLTRYLSNNFPLVERILTVAENYGIGDGLFAQASTSDSAFNDFASHMFDKWGNSVFCSNNNAYNLYEMQRLIVRELLIAGEVFIVQIKAPSGYPQLMLVPSEDVRHSGKESDKSVDGLYVDAYDKVYAYNIFTGENYQKVEAANVVHVKRHRHPKERRGVSAFAASLNSMRDHKDCMLLEKKAVKVHSTLAAVVEKTGGEAGNGLFGDVMPADHNGTPTTATANRGLEQAMSGAVVYLEQGEKVNLISSDRSTQGFMQFLELLVRDVCLNVSIPYEFLVNSEKLTGTAIRFVLEDASCFFRGLQNVLINGALQRIYSWVTSIFIDTGKLVMPKSGEPWLVSFTRPKSITVDLQRTSNVEIALIESGLLTFDAYYSARGKDWKAELRQRATEKQFLDELGLTFKPAQPQPSAPNEERAEEDKPDDEEEDKAA